MHDGLLNVQVEVVNVDIDNQQLYYRFKWLDAQGFTIGGEEPWKPVLIYGQQRKTLQAIAPGEAVADFRLILQSPDNTVNY
ncbi:MAG: YcfL family protein [Methylococcales bacterium]|nr:YcfL family protein [Methylococcales bacterium]